MTIYDIWNENVFKLFHCFEWRSNSCSKTDYITFIWSHRLPVLFLPPLWTTLCWILVWKHESSQNIERPKLFSKRMYPKKAYHTRHKSIIFISASPQKASIFLLFCTGLIVRYSIHLIWFEVMPLREFISSPGRWPHRYYSIQVK